MDNSQSISKSLKNNISGSKIISKLSGVQSLGSSDLEFSYGSSHM